MQRVPELVVIGGSWGGIQAALQILKGLPPNYSLPIVLVLHRLRDQEGNLQEIFERKTRLTTVEIEDKQQLVPGMLYLAPPNYHVLLENDRTFALDDSELENYSRPSIDVTFTSAADVYGDQVAGIILSGASSDGSSGLKYIFEKGGTALVQQPQEAEIDTMPLAAIRATPGCRIMQLIDIQEFLLSLHVN
ncbi:chemotaxis protein CheB [Pontibacter sp. Tf4]|uniref:chemotaxis protein CheB n=1 Tax=Pontibacter sp. Tf4 TaxID=2761620 RepID=UPI001626E16B|nr:chemotaxis protein CheB [Pontibacter sp. Tf4]MBB6612417.1 chemotaxis protein CheB [Pontibacter sp. Tf4]